jgi:hypothetical protein
MADLNFQDLMPVQSKLQQNPVTLASAATIAPTTALTVVTGTTSVATITPPVTGFHILWFKYTNAAPGALATSGNIETAYTPVQNRPFALLYDPNIAKYMPMTVA